MHRFHLSQYPIHECKTSVAALPGDRFPSQRVSAPQQGRFFGPVAGCIGVLSIAFCCLVLSGCGASFVLTGAAADSGSIVPSPSSVDFGTVSLGQSGNSKVSLKNPGATPVVISQISVSSDSFSIDGMGNMPITLAAGSSLDIKVHFKPKDAGTTDGDVTITSAPVSSASGDSVAGIVAEKSTTSSTTTVKLHGTGKKAAQGPQSSTLALTCSTTSFTGPGTDSCTVTSTTAAPSGGMSVALSSSNPAVAATTSLTIPENSTSATFIAEISAVTSAETVTLTASTSSASSSVGLQLNPYIAVLSLSASSISFGNVGINTAATRSLTLTSTGTAPVTLGEAALSGSGFSIPGAGLPILMNPGATVVLNVQFDPANTGAVAGQLIIVSDSSVNATAEIGLSGTGVAQGTPTLNALSCNNGSMTGAGTDACTVSLTSNVASDGVSVNLSSNNAAVTVPAVVTVLADSSSIGFTATVATVSSAQTATLTATSGGVSKTFNLQLGPSTPTLSLSTTSVSFGRVVENTIATRAVTLKSTGNAAVTVNSAAATGAGFSVSGATFPTTLNPGQTLTLNVQFDPAATGLAAGQLTITSNSSTGSTAVVSLGGTGTTGSPGNPIPALSALSCSSGSITGTATDSCTLTLTAAAQSGGLTINLSSSNAAATVPPSVTVASGSTSAGFTANVSAVSTAQTATLTATAGSVSESFALQLNPGTSTLSINANSVAFGNVALKMTSTQSLTLASTGTAPVTISAATLTGTGFAMTGTTFPMTLNPGQSATVNLQFDPTALGAATGVLTITSNSTTNGTAVISLSGTGISSEVDLTWDAPASDGDPVAGYNVYRSPDGGTSYQLVGSIDGSADTTYTDGGVQSGQAYDYVVKSFDDSGVESPASNMATVTIP